MSRLLFDQALAVVSGLGYAVVLPANEEQQKAGLDKVVCVKTYNEIIVGSYGLDAEEYRKFVLFKKVLRRKQTDIGEVVYLAL